MYYFFRIKDKNTINQRVSAIKFTESPLFIFILNNLESQQGQAFVSLRSVTMLSVVVGLRLTLGTTQVRGGVYVNAGKKVLSGR
jgi:hypothetical protein